MPPYYLEAWQPGETGLAKWVLEHNEAVRVIDQFADQRIQTTLRPGPRQPGRVFRSGAATAQSGC